MSIKTWTGVKQRSAALALTPELEGKALVKRAFGRLGELGCQYLSDDDKRQLEAMARAKLTWSARGRRLNLLPYRRLMPGRLDDGGARLLVERAFSPEAVSRWRIMPRGEREDLQRLAVVKQAALEQGLLAGAG